jgi:glycerol uptake facilitator-like aquaporin
MADTISRLDGSHRTQDTSHATPSSASRTFTVEAVGTFFLVFTVLTCVLTAFPTPRWPPARC